LYLSCFNSLYIPWDTPIILANSTWSLPEGAVNPGETLKQAVIRETKEEKNVPIYAIGTNVKHLYYSVHNLITIQDTT